MVNTNQKIRKDASVTCKSTANERPRCMTNTIPIVGSSKKMNNVNKDLVIQKLVESIASWQ